MAKLTLTDIVTGYGNTAAYNSNNTLIETALENTLSRDGTSPNAMAADLDMGAYQINNLADGSLATDAVNLRQLQGITAVEAGSIPSQTGNAGKHLYTDGSVVSWNDIASTFMDTVLDDVDAATARTTLGAVGLTGNETIAGNKTLSGDNTHSGTVTFSGTVAHNGNETFANPIAIGGASPIVLEGATADAYETTIAVTDPTADRTQTLQNQTGTISLCEPISGAAKDLVIKNNATNPTYQLDITATAIVLHDTSNNALQLQTWSVTADLTASGVNGLDTGTEANSTWYYVWAIYDGTNKRVVISTSSTSPTMPSGYTYKAYLGEWYNDSSGNLLVGNRKDRQMYYSGTQAVLTNGADQTETAIVISGVVPPTALSFKCYGQIQRGGAGNVRFRVVTAVNYITFAISTTDDHHLWAEFPNLSQTLYYICSTTGFDVDLNVQGYTS